MSALDAYPDPTDAVAGGGDPEPAPMMPDTATHRPYVDRVPWAREPERCQASRDAERANYGGPSYWRSLDEQAQRMRNYYLDHGDHERAERMLTRSLSEALQGNDGA